MPIYSKAEHIEQVITRCENHKKSKEFDIDCNISNFREKKRLNRET